MKLLSSLFLLTLTSFSESKSVVNQYKHTSYFYNSTQCNNSEPTIIEFVNYDNCNINNLNKCIQSINPKNDSVFKICAIEPVLNNINTGVSVFLTILIIFLVFLLYKMMCETELDNLCLKIKYKLEVCFCDYEEESQPINNYNSL
jgi:hypothetical protein